MLWHKSQFTALMNLHALSCACVQVATNLNLLFACVYKSIVNCKHKAVKWFVHMSRLRVELCTVNYTDGSCEGFITKRS